MRFQPFVREGLRGLLFLAGAATVGCGGNAPVSVVDAGAITVLASEIIGPVPPCGAGFAHPNVCCRDGACVAHPGAPFAACPADALILPDRRRCCALGGAGACVDAPIDDAGVDVGEVGRCSLPCGPEGRPSDVAPLLVCGNLGPALECTYCCSGFECALSVCHCPLLPDGGVCECNTPKCGACPSGWGAFAAQVDLCCADATRCFSQSTVVRAPEGGGTIFGPDGGESSWFAGGHLYDAKSDLTASTCTCSLDGTTTMQFDLAKGQCDIAGCGFSP
jgi:hypothetical protein